MKVMAKKPNAVQETLKAIAEKNGNITAEMVVNEARKKGSILWNVFDKAGLWDDKIAAEKARLTYAHMLIIRCKVYIQNDGEMIKIRGLVHLLPEKGYQTITDVLSNEQKVQNLLDGARKEFESFKRKYENISGLAEWIKIGEEVFANL